MLSQKELKVLMYVRRLPAPLPRLALLAAIVVSMAVSVSADIIEAVLVKVNGEILTKTDLEQRRVLALRSRGIQPADDEALKKAKIELAMKRAELKKAENTAADEASLQPLRDALASAEQALHAAEAASGKPAPALVRREQPGVDDTLKALKTEVAFARADLRKLERDENAPADALEQARTRLTDAEHKLAEHQAHATTGTP